MTLQFADEQRHVHKSVLMALVLHEIVCEHSVRTRSLPSWSGPNLAILPLGHASCDIEYWVEEVRQVKFVFPAAS